MLTLLTIRNYRSLEETAIPLEPLTAIVGPNGSGKTSILRAMACVFGEPWPSIRSFRIPQDFIGFDTSRPIEIAGWFDPPYIHQDEIGKAHKVVGLRLCCKPYKKSGDWGEQGDLHADFDPLDQKGEVPMVAVTPPRSGAKSQFRPLSPTTRLRHHTGVLFIDHRRSIAQHLPSIRGSILGRLFAPAQQAFSRHEEFKIAYKEALELLRTDEVRGIEDAIEATAKRMLGFMGRHAGSEVSIHFGFADPANPFQSLRLEYVESGLNVSGEELGLGIQSAVVVGIFEAFRQLGGGIGTVVIEEPEMYLHPQAQRYFYRLLCDMADSASCQIIYSTHSPIFADVNRFECLRLVRRTPPGSSRTTHVGEAHTANLNGERERQKLAGKFDPSRNEVLFASRALLVEGHGDRAAALTVAEKLGFDVDAEGIAIVDCGGKMGIPLVARVCRALEIPFSVLHDEDVWPLEDTEDKDKQEEENRRAAAENSRIADSIPGEAALYIARPTLEAMLGIGKWAADKPLKVIEKLHDLELEVCPVPLVDAVRSMMPIEGGADDRDNEPEDRPDFTGSP